MKIKVYKRGQVVLYKDKIYVIVHRKFFSTHHSYLLKLLREYNEFFYGPWVRYEELQPITNISQIYIDGNPSIDKFYQLYPEYLL